MASITYLTYYDVINEQKARALMEACAHAIAETNPTQLYFLSPRPGDHWRPGSPFTTSFVRYRSLS